MAAVATSSATPAHHLDGNVNTMDDDAQAALDFFTFKSKPRKPKAVVKRPIVVDDSGTDDSDDGGKKRKRQTNKARSQSHAWIRGESSEAARRRSESRGPDAGGKKGSGKAMDPIEIVDEEDETTSGPKLEAPPELTAEAKERIKRITESYLAQAPVEPDKGPDVDNEPEPEPQQLYHGEPMHILVTMVPDPARQHAESKAALKFYTKLRKFTVLRDQPLSIIRDALAQALNKSPDEIVLTWKGSELKYLRMTPQHLYLSEDERFEGYERSVWEKKLAEEANAAGSGLQDGEPIESQEITRVDDDEGADESPSNERIKLVIQGQKGQFRVAVLPTSTAGDMVSAYIKKFSIAAVAGRKMHVVFDGERVGAASTVAEMDWEDGDMIEISA